MEETVPSSLKEIISSGNIGKTAKRLNNKPLNHKIYSKIKNS